MARFKQTTAMPAAQFRKRREALGLTQVELAKELGVVEVTVRKWEAGENPIAPMVVRLLATLKAPRSVQKSSRTRRKLA